ncbi:MAG: acyl carrier protein [Bacteroidales bacterium]|nr:acyl carrier protein [Bacteroidales bacterium]MBQ1693961.1 acyl carrier protein [Bacteroidales bacterium]MBQ1905109.1 acyl carrier protein [Bacteroidales bacterium]MBQ2105237.1 acyl carrier protein [Bacteroidales bacterium]MBQ2501746.1 acyl carrier protein [Bacteroidales bacterium]
MDKKIFDAVSAIISDKLGVSESEITEKANFVSDLGADSLDVVELVMEIEKKFDIQIPDQDAETFKTVGDAVDYIAGKLNK